MAIVSTAQPLFQSWCIKTNAKESSDKSEHSKSSAVADDTGVCGHECHGRGLGEDSAGVGSHVGEGERGWMALLLNASFTGGSPDLHAKFVRTRQRLLLCEKYPLASFRD